MKFVDDNNDPYNGVVRVNGYDFGDRLLEDVWFEADMIDGEVQLNTVRVSDSGKDYFEDLNKKKWLKEAKNRFKKEDEHFQTADGENEVWLDEPVSSTCQPMKIEALSGDAFKSMFMNSLKL